MKTQNKEVLLETAFNASTAKNNGTIVWNRFYLTLFHNEPYSFATRLETPKSHYDLSNINWDKIKEMYPDSYIHKIELKVKKRDDDDDNGEIPILNDIEDNIISPDQDEYEHRRSYIFDVQYMANFAIVDFLNEIIYQFDGIDSVIWYSDNSNMQNKTPYELLHDLTSLLTVKTDKALNQYIQLVCMSNGEFYTVSSKINKVTIDFDKNYNEDFKPVYSDIENFIKDKERKSGLIVLNGIPGTGKSMLIRHIITNIPGNYIFVTPNIATHLADPEFMSFLLENKDSVFIMEDCENVIMERNTENSFSSAVSAILNMSDGLMSDIFNAKFICTFNADIKHIDPAILRSGRCITKYEFGKLSEDKTESLMKELGHELDSYEPMTIADIYNYKEGIAKEVKKNDKVKIGF